MSRPSTEHYARAAKGENGTRYGFVFVDELGFERHKPASFASLATAFTDYRL